MSNPVRVVGSSVISLILVSIPGLFVASIAFEWNGFLKTIFCLATVAEYVLTMCFIYERSEE